MTFIEYALTFAKVFVIGGAICAIAELLIVKTRLTPARILVLFLLIGIVLESVMLYEPLRKFAEAGITLPIIGFGASLAKGAIEMTLKHGIIGAFAGGLIQTAFGIGGAIVLSYFVTLIFSSKSK